MQTTALLIETGANSRLELIKEDSQNASTIAAWEGGGQ